MSRPEAAEIGQKHPKSIIHITRPEIGLPDADPTDERCYQRGADLLHEWVQKNLLVRSEKPSFYIYRQTLDKHVQVGIFTLTSCEQYYNGLIKKHEQTRAAPEADRTKTVDIQNANVGCVFLAYRGDTYKEVADYIRSLATGKPDRVAHLDFDNTEHELWVINDDERVKHIQDLFSKVPALYIADGHHRAASACNVWKKRRDLDGASYKGNEPYCYFMSCVFADTELCVIDYNRVITKNTLSNEELFAKLTANKFEITPLTGNEKPEGPSFLPFHYARPVGHKTFSLYIRGKWYNMKFVGEPVSNHPKDTIDSKILTDFVLTPIFGITDLRTAPNISFVGGTRGIKALEDKCQSDDTLAFAVPPISMHQLFDVADSGEMMPPKSTWFVPKLGDAMVIRFIESDE